MRTKQENKVRVHTEIDNLSETFAEGLHEFDDNDIIEFEAFDDVYQETAEIFPSFSTLTSLILLETASQSLKQVQKFQNLLFRRLTPGSLLLRRSR